MKVVTQKDLFEIDEKHDLILFVRFVFIETYFLRIMQNKIEHDFDWQILALFIPEPSSYLNFHLNVEFYTPPLSPHYLVGDIISS